ncbi:hypothetical protein [Hydrogenophaga sp.]|uniref:hypothetical protein n=1 Tax=Hydrogenophaga sp. TaxID=1904254 RepID=UPI0025C23FD4|nr:hypothetical protein [Hydrogenophaga sp.]
MIHPVFRLAASQPLLLAEHAAAYADLVSEELSARSAQLKRTLAYQVAGVACLLVAAVLVGVAILLWASWPMVEIRAPWLYVLTPALPMGLGLVFLWMAQNREVRKPFASLRLQLAEDAALLKATASP